MSNECLCVYAHVTQPVIIVITPECLLVKPEVKINIKNDKNACFIYIYPFSLYRFASQCWLLFDERFLPSVDTHIFTAYYVLVMRWGGKRIANKDITMDKLIKPILDLDLLSAGKNTKRFKCHCHFSDRKKNCSLSLSGSTSLIRLFVWWHCIRYSIVFYVHAWQASSPNMSWRGVHGQMFGSFSQCLHYILLFHSLK